MAPRLWRGGNLARRHSRCQLAEGILCDNILDCIVLTDIYGQQCLQTVPVCDYQGILYTIDLPRMLSSFAFCHNSDAYLCAWKHGSSVVVIMVKSKTSR